MESDEEYYDSDYSHNSVPIYTSTDDSNENGNNTDSEYSDSEHDYDNDENEAKSNDDQENDDCDDDDNSEYDNDSDSENDINDNEYKTEDTNENDFRSEESETANDCDEEVESSEDNDFISEESETDNDCDEEDERSEEECYSYNNHGVNFEDSKNNSNFSDYFDIKNIVMMPSGKYKAVTGMSKRCTHRFTCDFSYELFDLARCKPERRLIEDEMRDTIMDHVLQEHGGGKFSDYKILDVKKVFNPCLWDVYLTCKSNISINTGSLSERMLFHGTTEQAARSIVKYGFDINKASPDGMFGKAIYFAEHSSKSNQYTYGFLGGNGCPQHRNKSCYSCPRTMILSRVVMGPITNKTRGEKIQPNLQIITTIFGVPTPNGLRYPEYAIFNGAQAYPEYLITYVIVP